jgi:hypothetical protein
MLMFAWVVVLVWGILWVVGFVLTKHINAGNTIASVGTLLVVLLVSGEVLGSFVGTEVAALEFRLFALPLFIAILAKHIDPVREYLAEVRVGNNGH